MARKDGGESEGIILYPSRSPSLGWKPTPLAPLVRGVKAMRPRRGFSTALPRAGNRNRSFFSRRTLPPLSGSTYLGIRISPEIEAKSLQPAMTMDFLSSSSKSSSISATPAGPPAKQPEHEAPARSHPLGPTGQEFQNVISSTDAAFRQHENVIPHRVHDLRAEFPWGGPTKAREPRRAW